MRKPTRFTSSLAGELLTASPLVSRDAPGLAAMSRNWPGRDGCSHNVLTRRYPVEVANLRRMTSRHGECPANRRGWPGTRHSGSACGDLSRVPPPLGPDRYEAAVNTVWDDFPVWGLCLYDTANSPAVVLDAAERTHPRIVSPSGTRRANGRFQQLADFQALPPVPDPLEQTTPIIELVDRSAAEVRGALIQIGLGRVADTILDDLLLGVTVAVSNALAHGRPPATVRIWAAPDRIVISVHDQGRGPADPLAGLVPPRGTATLGLGLWVINQLDIDVALKHADDGFTIRLRGGTTIR